jgi:hypothetical protein
MVAMLLSTDDLRLDPAPLLGKLCITIIAPLLFGKACRGLMMTYLMTYCVVRCKVYLGLLQQLCVVLIAWMQLSKASDQIKSTPAAVLSSVLLTSVMIHGAYLLINWCAACVLRLPKRDAKAVIILSSQKTFPVAITVITFLDASFAHDVGLMVMPCVCSHFVQLFWDAIIATWWSHSHETYEALEAEVTPEAVSDASGPRFFEMDAYSRLEHDACDGADTLDIGPAGTLESFAHGADGEDAALPPAEPRRSSDGPTGHTMVRRTSSHGDESERLSPMAVRSSPSGKASPTYGYV